MAFDEQALRDLVEFTIPFHSHLQLELLAIDPLQCWLKIPVDEVLLGSPNGSWHAGVINAGISACGGALAMTQIDLKVDKISTLNTRADFLAPSRAEDLLFEARMIKTGKRIIQTHVEVRHESDELFIASGVAVFSVFRAGSKK